MLSSILCHRMDNRNPGCKFSFRFFFLLLPQIIFRPDRPWIPMSSLYWKKSKRSLMICTPPYLVARSHQMIQLTYLNWAAFFFTWVYEGRHAILGPTPWHKTYKTRPISWRKTYKMRSISWRKTCETRHTSWRKKCKTRPISWRKTCKTSPISWRKTCKNAPYFMTKDMQNAPYFMKEDMQNAPYFMTEDMQNAPYFMTTDMQNASQLMSGDSQNASHFMMEDTQKVSQLMTGSGTSTNSWNLSRRRWGDSKRCMQHT